MNDIEGHVCFGRRLLQSVIDDPGLDADTYRKAEARAQLDYMVAKGWDWMPYGDCQHARAADGRCLGNERN